MMKKSYLTPVLAGVLAVTVVGSGVGYYFTFVKDSGSKDKDKETKKSSSKITTLTVDEAAEKIEENLEKVEAIANGELDTGFSAEVSYTMPSSAAAELGVDLKTISMSLDAKQKDKMSEIDYGFNYDSKSVLSANIVYDNANETAYLSIPQLSNDYLTGTVSDMQSLVEESTGTSFDDMAAEMGTIDTSELDALADIDYDALFTDLESYADTITANIPEAKDGANRTGSVDGVSYDLTSKTYTITTADVQKIATAIKDKAVSDETLKSTFEKMGVDDASYSEMWADFDNFDGEGDQSADFTLFYNGDDFAGWSISADDQEMYMITSVTDTDVVIDWSFESEGEGFNAKGAVSVSDDTLDGKIDFNVVEADTTMSMTISYDSLKVTDDSLTGSISYSIKEDSTEEAAMKITFNTTSDKFDVAVSVSAEGEDLGTLQVTAQETNASDISIPTGTGYKFTDEAQLEQYMSGCDIEGWTASLEDILGSDLYNAIFAAQPVYDDNVYTEFNWDEDIEWDVAEDDSAPSFGTGTAL